MLAAGAVVEVWTGGRHRRLVADGGLGTLGIGVGDGCCITVVIDMVTRNGVVSGSILRSTLGAG